MFHDEESPRQRPERGGAPARACLKVKLDRARRAGAVPEVHNIDARDVEHMATATAHLSVVFWHRGSAHRAQRQRTIAVSTLGRLGPYARS